MPAANRSNLFSISSKTTVDDRVEALVTTQLGVKPLFPQLFENALVAVIADQLTKLCLVTLDQGTQVAKRLGDDGLRCYEVDQPACGLLVARLVLIVIIRHG